MFKVRNRLLLFCLFISLASTAQEYQYNYSLFLNSAMSGDYFFSKTKSSGGSIIKSVNDKIPVSETKFHTPGNALELTYKNTAGGNWNASIYRQEKRGMDHFRKAEFNLPAGKTRNGSFQKSRILIILDLC